MKWIYFILVSILLFSNCKKEAVQPTPSTEVPTVDHEPRIDSIFIPYVERFLEEAKNRNQSITIEGLEVKYVEEFSVPSVRNQGFCGYGWWVYPGKNNPRVEILKSNENCWETITDLQKENFMAHELGHALLSRGHTNQKLLNGCGHKSIMCSEGCSNFSVFSRSGPLREYYFDELFNQRTLVPRFIQKNQFVKLAFSDDFENSELADWEFFKIDNAQQTANYIYSIDSARTDISSKALAIKSIVGHPEDVIAIVLQRFELKDFEPCTNLRVTANIRTKGLTKGYFEMGMSLRERDEQGELHRIYLDTKRQISTSLTDTVFDNYSLDIFCLPEETEVVTVSFVLYSARPATLFVDDIRVEVLE